jgi:DNA-binding response OmpR family regulator
MSLRAKKNLLLGFSGVLKSVTLWEGMPQKRILIVEDNSDLRRMFKTALSLAGFDVDEAGDGLEALRVVEERRPDLVVLDLVLRALDGLSVQQELAARAATANIPIVIVTGSTIDTDNVEVACVLRKPVMPDELIRTVRQCLRDGAADGLV